MFENYILELYLFQLTVAQEDPVQHLKQKIDQVDQLFWDYLLSMQNKHEGFRGLMLGEMLRIEALKTDLTREVEELALDLSENGTDVTVCLNIALEKVTELIADRGR